MERDSLKLAPFSLGLKRLKYVKIQEA